VVKSSTGNEKQFLEKKMSTKLIAFGKRIVVKPLENEQNQSAGGITLVPEKLKRGRVQDVSYEIEKNKKVLLRVGDVVLYNPNTCLNYGDSVLLEVDDILAKVEK
jgi:co-chaperonin GroES (HSP10)